MRRGLYFLAGTAAGVYATSKARRAAEALTVDGVHDRLTGWFAGARVLGAEARAGMAEKEAELTARLEAGTDRALPQRDNVRSLNSGRSQLTSTDGKGDD